MQFSTVIAFLAGAVAVHALPGGAGGVSNTCAKDNTIACCDTTGANGIGANILGGSCIIPNLLSISNNCPAGNSFCCPTNSDGSINVELTCTPISA